MDKDKLIEWIKRHQYYEETYNYQDMYVVNVCKLVAAIHNGEFEQEPCEVIRILGKGCRSAIFQCSACKGTYPFLTKHCPKCGRPLRKDVE